MNGTGDYDVQLAVLSAAVDALRKEIQALRVDVCDTLRDHEQRIRSNEKAVTKATGLQAGFQVVTGAIAAWIGSKL